MNSWNQALSALHRACALAACVAVWVLAEAADAALCVAASTTQLATNVSTTRVSRIHRRRISNLPTSAPVPPAFCAAWMPPARQFAASTGRNSQHMPQTKAAGKGEGEALHSRVTVLYVTGIQDTPALEDADAGGARRDEA